MKQIIFCILALLLGTSFSLIAQSAEPSNEKFDPNRDADADIQTAIQEAQQLHKRILLDVGGEWCVWCHRLDTLFDKNTDLRKFRDKNFIVLKINVSKENKNEKVLSKYPKVAGYPHLFVLDETGQLLTSQDTGELEYPQGFPIKGHDKDKVLAFLHRWAK